jgi:hypothetical protein
MEMKQLAGLGYGGSSVFRPNTKFEKLSEEEKKW